MSLRPLSCDDSGLSRLFTRSEFDDCISRIVTQSKVGEQPFLPCKEFVENLWVMTNGHPGVTREMMRFLMDALVCLVIDESPTLTDDTNLAPVTRSFGHIEIMEL